MQLVDLIFLSKRTKLSVSLAAIIFMMFLVVKMLWKNKSNE